MSNLDIDVLVNKYNRLDRNYVPNDLIVLDQNEKNFHKYIYPELKPTISKTIYDDYKLLEQASIKDGLHVVVDSGYRDFFYQSKIWLDNYKKYYKEFKGDEKADIKAYDKTNMYVAWPGTSEHQTGYAFDIGAYRKNIFHEVLPEDEEIKWMIENSYKYGFILRYPKGKENLTGYSYESWHYRYVGKDVAKKIHDEGITYDEYYAYYIEK
jgi:D-alanyl-D-alanine carboxypeptidase